MFSLDTDAQGGCFPSRPAECPAFVQCGPWLRAQGSPVPHRSTFLGLPKPQLLLARHCEVTTFSCGAPPHTPAGNGAGPTEFTSWASFSLKDSSPCRLEQQRAALRSLFLFSVKLAVRDLKPVDAALAEAQDLLTHPFFESVDRLLFYVCVLGLP